MTALSRTGGYTAPVKHPFGFWEGDTVKRCVVKRTTLIIVAAAAAICGHANATTATPIVSVGAYAPAATFTVPIEISGASDLVTWQFDLGFDASDLTALSVTEGPFTSSGGLHLSLFLPGVIDNVSGLVSLVAGGYLDLPPGPSGSGVLAYIDFQTVGSGNSPLELMNVIVMQNGTDATVPEPASIALVALGFSVLAVGRRRHER